MRHLALSLLVACTAPSADKPVDTDDTVADTDTGEGDTDTGVEDTASGLEAPETFVGNVGYTFVDVAVANRRFACATTLVGRVFCWREAEYGLACTQPSRGLRGGDVTVPNPTSLPCVLDLETLAASCWDWETGVAEIASVGPFASVDGVCGLMLDGSIECWDQFAECPAAAPSGAFLSLDTRAGGSAIAADGSMHLWGGSCLESDDVGCTVCADRVSAPGPFTHTSNALFGGACGALAAGGVECALASTSLQDEAPTVPLTDVDVLSFDRGPGGCGLDEAGLAVCWGDAAGDETSTPYVQLEAGGSGAFYGRTADGVIEQFGVSYEWIACDPPE